jgi:hypothetical protein
MSKLSVTFLVMLVCGGQQLRAADPDSQQQGLNRPVTSQEVQQLQHEISDSSSSTVEGIFAYHQESGDVNNKLNFFRYGAQVNYLWKPSTMVYLRGVGTSYLTLGDVLNEHGFNGTGGIRVSLSDAVEFQAEAGGTHFSTDSATVNAMGTIRYKSSGGSALYATFTRSNVEESLLSTTGIHPIFGPFAGQLVGQVMDNRGVGGGLLKLTRRLDVSGEGGGGVRTGQNVESNGFRTASAGAGFNIIAGPDESSLNLLRVSYGLQYFGFDENLFGFGGASLTNSHGRPVPVALLGTDGISPVASPGNPGVGGYFSPENFVSNVGRLELRGRPHPNVQYDISGFLGAQDYTGSTMRVVNGFFGSLTLRLNDRVSVPIVYMYDNVGPFTQQSVFARLAVKF